jgi:hypothetical protein
LEAGHAVTIWWIVTNPDGEVAVLYAAGHVIDADGTAEFGGSLKVGDSDGYVMGDDTSLEDAAEATVTLVIRDHGPAKPGLVNAQIHTFDACNPEGSGALLRPADVGPLAELRTGGQHRSTRAARPGRR